MIYVTVGFSGDSMVMMMMMMCVCVCVRACARVCVFVCAKKKRTVKTIQTKHEQITDLPNKQPKR